MRDEKQNKLIKIPKINP